MENVSIWRKNNMIEATDTLTIVEFTTVMLVAFGGMIALYYKNYGALRQQISDCRYETSQRINKVEEDVRVLCDRNTVDRRDINDIKTQLKHIDKSLTQLVALLKGKNLINGNEK